jgi:7-alpha-hydroxysteroid dehydrogenase
MSLNGKSCIVTGAANGIGRSIARHFAEAGAEVLLVDSDEKALAEELELLEAQSLKVQAFAGDLTRKLTIANLISATLDAFDKIDVLVNAQRYVEYGDPLVENIDQMQRLFDRNVLANLRLSNAVAMRFNKQNEEDDVDPRERGSIINISSITARRTIKNLGAYAVSSAAVEQLTRSLAVSLAPSGIRVNAIALGSVMTNFMSKNLKEDTDLRQRILAATPMGRMGEPDEAADVAMFLASTASSFMTGQILTVDGGRMLIDPVDLPAY